MSRRPRSRAASAEAKVKTVDAAVPQARAGTPAPTKKSPKAKARGRLEAPESLRSLVGEATYEAWLEMLRGLVPAGRTHRIAVLVAGMLQHAADVVPRRKRRKLEKGSLIEALVDPEATHPEAFAYTPFDGPDLPLEGIVAGLFRGRPGLPARECARRPVQRDPARGLRIPALVRHAVGVGWGSRTARRI